MNADMRAVELAEQAVSIDEYIAALEAALGFARAGIHALMVVCGDERKLLAGLADVYAAPPGSARGGAPRGRIGRWPRKRRPE